MALALDQWAFAPPAADGILKPISGNRHQDEAGWELEVRASGSIDDAASTKRGGRQGRWPERCVDRRDLASRFGSGTRNEGIGAASVQTNRGSCQPRARAMRAGAAHFGRPRCWRRPGQADCRAGLVRCPSPHLRLEPPALVG